MKKTLFCVAALLLSSMAFAELEKLTIDVTAESLAGKYSWDNGKYYLNVKLDANISLHVDTAYDAKTGKVSNQSGVYFKATEAAPADWRMYQARVDSFFLEAANGALIDSVQLTYGNKDGNGTWSTKRGSSLGKEFCLASDAVLATGGQSKVCLYMGCAGTSTSGQMRIQRFRIFYRGKKQAEDPTFKFADANVYQKLSAGTCTNALTNTSDGAVTYKSDNEQVATVDNNGLVTLVGLGDVKITANVAATAAFNAASASYMLAVRPENWNRENFAGAGTSSTNYATSPASSVNPSEATGLKWTVLFGYIGTNSGNMGGFGPVVRQRKEAESASDPGYLVSDSIEGGIDSLSFQWNSNGTESGNWNTIVYINNDTVGAITDAATGIKPASEVPTFSVGNLKKEGKFVIRIVNNTPAGGTGNAKRFVVGNLQWYSYTDPTHTGCASIEQEAPKAQKVLRDGKLYIYKDGKYINVLGL